LGTQGGVIKGINVGREREIAKSGVVVSVDVGEKRESAKSVVALGKSGTGRVIIIERKDADSIVVAGDGVQAPSSKRQSHSARTRPRNSRSFRYAFIFRSHAH